MAAIPFGQLTTYGDVARLAGSPRATRQIGGILSRLPPGSKLPWHRVVNRQDTISQTSEDFARQLAALQKEGILLESSGRFPLDRYRWLPDAGVEDRPA